MPSYGIIHTHVRPRRSPQAIGLGAGAAAANVGDASSAGVAGWTDPSGCAGRRPLSDRSIVAEAFVVRNCVSTNGACRRGSGFFIESIVGQIPPPSMRMPSPQAPHQPSAEVSVFFAPSARWAHAVTSSLSKGQSRVSWSRKRADFSG